MDASLQDQEVDRNYQAFEAELPSILAAHRGQFALMHSQRVEAYYDSASLVLAEGRRRFPDKPFSIQEVTDQPVDLGFFSHAVHTGLA